MLSPRASAVKPPSASCATSKTSSFIRFGPPGDLHFMIPRFRIQRRTRSKPQGSKPHSRNAAVLSAFPYPRSQKRDLGCVETAEKSKVKGLGSQKCSTWNIFILLGLLPCLLHNYQQDFENIVGWGVSGLWADSLSQRFTREVDTQTRASGFRESFQCARRWQHLTAFEASDYGLGGFHRLGNLLPGPI